MEYHRPGEKIEIDSNLAMPEELAEAVLFLTSYGSNHMSGQNIIFGVPMRMGPPPREENK
jgi:hypothetical protein